MYVTSSPPHLLTSSPPHLHLLTSSSSPPHLLTSSPPHLLLLTSSPPPLNVDSCRDRGEKLLIYCRQQNRKFACQKIADEVWPHGERMGEGKGWGGRSREVRKCGSAEVQKSGSVEVQQMYQGKHRRAENVTFTGSYLCD
jgi:hypothetical protein